MSKSEKPHISLVEYLRADRAYSEADKIEACCSDHIIYRNYQSDKIVLLPSYCGSRWCDVCGPMQRARAEATVSNILNKYNHNLLRFITLTQKAYTRESLLDSMARIDVQWQRLRRSKFWAEYVHGSYVRKETVWNPKRRWWHVHYHILALSEFMPQKLLSSQWYKLTGDSFRCDVRLIRGGAEKELSKYLSKFEHRSNLPLRELVEAWAGKRSYDVYGCFRKLEAVDKSVKPEPEWERIGSTRNYIYKLRTTVILLTDVEICNTIRRCPELYGRFNAADRYFISQIASIII